jgi:signal transduction histidine kinase
MAAPLVYVVDDDPLKAADLARLLTEEARVDARACHGAAALAAAAAERPPDGVVADATASGVDGISIVEAMTRTDPDLAVLLVTRAGDADALSAARSRVGPLRVVARPFDPADLVCRLRAGLERRQLVAELAAARALAQEEHRVLDATRARVAETAAALEDRSRELGTATERLIAAEKLAAVGRVVTGLAHEISKQLALVGYAEAIRSRVSHDPELGEFADIIVSAQKRLVAMIDQIRDFTLDPSGAAALVREPCDVVAVVDEALAILRYDPDVRARNLARAFRARPLAALDHAKFAQVVLNLVSNAVLATEPGDTIAVELDVDDADLVLTVSDRGVGMPPEVLAHLGEPFFSTRGDRGSGLGVGICMRIVEEHGGSLRFESQVGRGTRAFVRLPTIGEGAR